MELYKDVSDQELVTLLEEGSEGAFDEIYRRYWEQLFNEAHKRLNNLELSEEIVQDIFIDLWTKRTQKKIVTLFPYLITAIRYQVFMVYNKKKSIPFFEEPLDHIAFSSDESDSHCFEKDLIVAVTAWLESQPEKRREIFRLRYLEDMTTREIAEELHISQKTVQNQLNTSQESLRSSVAKLLTLVVIILHSSSSN